MFLKTSCYLRGNSSNNSIGSGAYFAYKYMNHWYLKKDVVRVKFGTRTQIII